MKKDKNTKSKKKRIIIGVGIVVILCIIAHFATNYYYREEFKECVNEAKEDIRKEKYDKAIESLEKKKNTKCSDRNQIALLLGDAYLKKYEYDKAECELVEAYEQTKDETVKDKIDEIKKDKDKIVSKRYEIICESINSAISNGEDIKIFDLYEEAKDLVYNDKIYLVTSKYYFENNKYGEAIGVLDEGIDILKKNKKEKDTKKLKDTKKDYNEVITKLDEYNKTYNKLYSVCKRYDKDAKEIVNIIKNKDFKTAASVNNVTFYYESDFIEGDINDKNVLAVYSNGGVYYGEVTKSKRCNHGIFLIAKSEKEYYTYEGEWKNDLPNGEGVVKHVIDGKNESVTKGTFLDGYEDGKMTIEKSCGKMEYEAKKGEPVVLKDNGKKIKTPDGDLVIGYYKKDDKKVKACGIKKGTKWKVQGLM